MEFYSTEESYLSNLESNDRHEKIKSIGAYFSVSAIKGNFTQNMQAVYNEVADFLFTDIYGVEIPVDRKLGFLSFDGKGEVNRDLDWTYEFSFNSNNTQNYPNKDDRWLVWKQNIYSAKTGFEHQFKYGMQKIGAELKTFDLYDDLAGETLNTKLLSLHHRFEVQMNSNLRFYSNFMVVENQEMAFKENAGIFFDFTDSQSLNFDITYSSRLPEEDNSLWYWMIDKGFGRDTLGTYQLDELPVRAKYFQAGLKWKIVFSNDVNFQFNTIYSRNIDEYLFKYQLISRGSRIETGTYEFINNLDASFFKIPIDFNFHITPKIYQRISYTYHHQLSRDESLFKMMPNHSLGMNINWKPVESFKIWTSIQAQSKTFWYNAEPIDGLVVSVLNTQEEIYSSTSTSRLIWDFGIKKYFWNKQIALSIDLRNVTDQHFRYHPISQKHTLTLFLMAHLNLP